MAAPISEQTVKKAKAYTYFNPKLIEAIAAADIYDSDKVKSTQQQWEIHDVEKPYLKHIKSLSESWPPLRLLADFMEISTSPIQWDNFKSGQWSQENRDERASRTSVTRLDYLASGDVKSQSWTKFIDLRDAVKEQDLEASAAHRKFRLFVVEDLSRDVIELLGAHYDIEPAFFRDQIFDYAWYNTRDRWMDPPRLNVVIKKQRWLQIRFATARYFKTAEAFVQAVEQYKLFNVFRKAEDDRNNNAIWDEPAAIVGLSRTRAAFWVGSSEKEGSVGVILVDPTIEAGSPLWYGYRNWEETPSVGKAQMPLPGPPRKSLYKGLVYWLEKQNAFGQSSATDPASNINVPIQALLHLICSEWLTIAEYIQTRLGQIEWEISYPEHFLDPGIKIDAALKKLHVWRRLVPLYREMLTETLQRVLHFPCETSSLSNTGSNSENLGNQSATTIAASNNAASTSNASLATNNVSAAVQTNPSCHCQCSVHDQADTKRGPMNELRDDFARVHSYMEEYQKRIDRLTSVVTAIISIEDSRRGIEDNENVARLTWLATFFIPFSLIASILSMQADISTLRETIGWYFLTAILVALVVLGLAIVLTRFKVQNYWLRRDKKKRA